MLSLIKGNRNTLRRQDKAITCYRCGKVGHIAAKYHTGRGPETGRILTEMPQGAVKTDMKINETYHRDHIEKYWSLPINSPKRKIASRGMESRAEKNNRQRNRWEENRNSLM